MDRHMLLKIPFSHSTASAQLKNNKNFISATNKSYFCFMVKNMQEYDDKDRKYWLMSMDKYIQQLITVATDLH